MSAMEQVAQVGRSEDVPTEPVSRAKLAEATLAVTGTKARPVAAPRWVSAYTFRLVVTDTIAVLCAVIVAYLFRFRFDGPLVTGNFNPTYLSIAGAIAVYWLAALSFIQSRDRRIIGSGPLEYTRVFNATWRMFALVAVLAYLTKVNIGRGFLAVAAPLGCGLLLLGRLAWRQWLHRQRDDSQCLNKLLVIGNRVNAEHLIQQLGANPGLGYQVVGACVPEDESDGGADILGVPICGDTGDAARIAARLGANVVAVTGSDTITTETVRKLGWDLEGTNVDMVMAPVLVDVAGPRVIMQPVNGVPLMYIDEPHFSGNKYVVKSVLDWFGAFFLVLLLSPALIIVGLLVVITNPGPVFYLQERIGRDGKKFEMIKFRSMVVGAHDRLGEVLAAEGIDEIGMFYKPTNDPRVTPIGRVLRRYSLDELPQLFNVLAGQMSLVGPRPQIEAEVAQYDRAARRRLRVKPGLTGLWQVSGRSTLDPHQGIRMDIYYVENWSVFGDLLILLRTLTAVIQGDGAR